MLRRFVIIAAVALALPGAAQAWWNNDWTYRKAITIDTTAAGADISGVVNEAAVLVRLHTGNFSHFLDVTDGGGDIRFIAEDDKTPLKHHLEKFDAVNEMAFIWVKVPAIKGAARTGKIWMYFGNATAPKGEDAAATYSAGDALIYHFGEAGGVPQDRTANANHAATFTAQANPASLIGGGARFAGSGALTINDSPSLRINPAQGWTFSTWIKVDAPQAAAYVLDRVDGASRLTLAIDGTSAYARYTGASGAATETPRNANLTPGVWHHLALNLANGRLAVFLDGAEAGGADATAAEMGGNIAIGASTDGAHFLTADIDELRIANAARSADAIRFAARTEGTDARAVGYGADESIDTEAKGDEEGGQSWLPVILKSVTKDGWVVIGICAVMGVISLIVMALKAFVIGRVRGRNIRFLAEYHKLGIVNQDQLDYEGETPDEAQNDESPLLGELFGRHDHFQGSPLYRLYHQAMLEVRARLGTAAGAQSAGIDARALTAIRATLDAVQVREMQKLNAQMVLLTIAISGGPFLGLLGTVIGVMVTFAAIAATGDVNINAIAPGMAAALLATVAGLGVAIPALFGYNYLGSRIKEITADMHVFVDELVAKIGEMHGT